MAGHVYSVSKSVCPGWCCDFADLILNRSHNPLELIMPPDTKTAIHTSIEQGHDDLLGLYLNRLKDIDDRQLAVFIWYSISWFKADSLNVLVSLERDWPISLKDENNRDALELA